MNKQNRNRLKDAEDILMVTGLEEAVGRLGGKGEGIKKYELVVTN